METNTQPEAAASTKSELIEPLGGKGFVAFMKLQCCDCAYESIDDPEHCTTCGIGYADAYNAGFIDAKRKAVDILTRDLITLLSP